MKTSVPHEANNPLFVTVYEELKRLARHQLRLAGSGTTLCTTELVHEAFLKLEAGRRKEWDGRALRCSGFGV